jgi:hypothetical protein
VSRVAVTPEAYRQLRNQFSERYLREQKLFAYREALRDDQALLALLYARRQGEGGQTIALRGAGYFLPASSGESSVVLALRERIEREYGPGAVQRRAERVREELHRLVPAADDRDVEIPAAGYPSFPRTYSERYRDLATELAALSVLDRALPLRSDTKREGAGVVLSESERGQLAGFAGRLEDALVRLVGSDRPDVGLTLLIGMARLEAFSESVRTGRLVLIDVFPPESAVVPSPRRRHLEALRRLGAEAGEDFRAGADAVGWRAR